MTWNLKTVKGYVEFWDQYPSNEKIKSKMQKKKRVQIVLYLVKNPFFKSLLESETKSWHLALKSLISLRWLNFWKRKRLSLSIAQWSASQYSSSRSRVVPLGPWRADKIPPRRVRLLGSLPRINTMQRAIQILCAVS